LSTAGIYASQLVRSDGTCDSSSVTIGCVRTSNLRPSDSELEAKQYQSECNLLAPILSAPYSQYMESGLVPTAWPHAQLLLV
jgi:hypothetical protein